MNLNMFMGAIAALCLVASTAEAKKIEGNGELEIRRIEVKDFQKVYLRNLRQPQKVFDLSLFRNGKTYPEFVYRQTGETSLKVTTDSNLFPYLQFLVEDGELRVEVTKGDAVYPTRLLLEGTSAGLEEVNIGGGADFTLASDFRGDNLSVSVGGGGDFLAKKPMRIQNGEFSTGGGGDMDIQNLTCDRAYIRTSGGGDCDIRGKAREAEIRTSGGGDIDAEDFVVENLTVQCSGGGDADVHATRTLTAKASGGGDISYRGNPQTNISTSGGGSTRKID